MWRDMPDDHLAAYCGDAIIGMRCTLSTSDLKLRSAVERSIANMRTAREQAEEGDFGSARQTLEFGHADFVSAAIEAAGRLNFGARRAT